MLEGGMKQFILVFAYQFFFELKSMKHQFVDTYDSCCKCYRIHTLRISDFIARTFSLIIV